MIEGAVGRRQGPFLVGRHSDLGDIALEDRVPLEGACVVVWRAFHDSAGEGLGSVDTSFNHVGPDESLRVEAGQFAHHVAVGSDHMCGEGPRLILFIEGIGEGVHSVEVSQVLSRQDPLLFVSLQVLVEATWDIKTIDFLDAFVVTSEEKELVLIIFVVADAPAGKVVLISRDSFDVAASDHIFCCVFIREHLLLVGGGVKVDDFSVGPFCVHLVSDEGAFSVSQPIDPTCLILCGSHILLLSGFLQLEHGAVVFKQYHACVCCNLHLGVISVRGKALQDCVIGGVVKFYAAATLDDQQVVLEVGDRVRNRGERNRVFEQHSEAQRMDQDEGHHQQIQFHQILSQTGSLYQNQHRPRPYQDPRQKFIQEDENEAF